MARRKLEDRSVRKISHGKSGSYTVTLPIEHIRVLKWRDHQKVVIERKGMTLVIRDWK